MGSLEERCHALEGRSGFWGVGIWLVGWFFLGIAFSATSLCSTYFSVGFPFPVPLPPWPSGESLSPRVVCVLWRRSPGGPGVQARVGAGRAPPGAAGSGGAGLALNSFWRSLPPF